MVPSTLLGRETGMFTPLQKRIIWVGLAILGFMLLVVPWKDRNDWPRGYRPIFYPPNGAVTIDIVRLVIRMSFVFCAATAGVVLAGRKQKKLQIESADTRKTGDKQKDNGSKFPENVAEAPSLNADSTLFDFWRSAETRMATNEWRDRRRILAASTPGFVGWIILGFVLPTTTSGAVLIMVVTIAVGLVLLRFAKFGRPVAKRFRAEWIWFLFFAGEFVVGMYAESFRQNAPDDPVL